jgi:hypothetical protein
MELFFPGRRSSGVEQLIRNQQAAGSNPIAGSMNINFSIFDLLQPRFTKRTPPRFFPTDSSKFSLLDLRPSGFSVYHHKDRQLLQEAGLPTGPSCKPPRRYYRKNTELEIL